MKIYLATDHAGVDLKNKVKKVLEDAGHDVEDCGAYEYDQNDDYPDLIGKAAKKVSENPHEKGIIFGGSGQGEAIVANKFDNVRCALFYAPAVPTQPVNIEGRTSSDPFEILRLSREHNGANMLSIGFRFIQEEDVYKAIKIWLSEPDPIEERHIRRIEKIRKIEEK
ncbi:MAG TPA: RpiB/LacA/LacB family sugar-phosphate isomerase [Candidatus Saccharimonadales bacterium]|nr:RpiB/LacA/LacB family sugar-phosphate isomerase [Candidatus Saccharimonadales bacterium]